MQIRGNNKYHIPHSPRQNNNSGTYTTI